MPWSSSSSRQRARYLSKVFNDEWMADYGFLSTAVESTVGDVLRRKDGGLPTLVHTHPNETVREAIDILREYGVSQLPVVKAEPPVMAAEVVGSVVERDLLDALFNGRARLADPVEGHLSPALPMIGAGEPFAGQHARMRRDARLSSDDGKPSGADALSAGLPRAARSARSPSPARACRWEITSERASRQPLVVARARRPTRAPVPWSGL